MIIGPSYIKSDREDSISSSSIGDHAVKKLSIIVTSFYQLTFSYCLPSQTNMALYGFRFFFNEQEERSLPRQIDV